jgi:hypothetical protein
MNSPFAYLSATANLWKEPMILQKGQTLNFCYGVALWDGAIEARQIQALYQHWLGLAKDSR